MYWLFKIMSLVALIVFVEVLPESEWRQAALAAITLLWCGLGMLDYKIAGSKDADK